MNIIARLGRAPLIAARVLTVIVGVFVGSAIQAQEPSSQSTYRAGVHVVSIDASVRRRNAIVPGLTARDFELLDNGVRQSVELAPLDTTPIDLTLVFDGSSVATRFEREFKSNFVRIAAMLRPIDRIRVVVAGGTVREVLSMQRADGLAHMDILNSASSDMSSDLTIGWGALTLDGLLLALTRSEEVGRRHLVVAFSWGIVWGILGLDAIEPIARRSDALLHVMLAPPNRWRAGRKRETVTQEDVQARRALTAAAETTGGEVHDLNDAVGAFKSVFADFTRSYVLRYTLTGVPSAGWHSVLVTAPTCQQCTVRTRNGYFGS